MWYLGSRGDPLVCAEPSPDAISTAALTAAIKADVAGRGSAAFGVSYAESAASIAARTAAVQVLRDIQYRACEALINGVVGPQHYNQILAAAAYTTIGLMAVDGLGRPQIATQPSIGTPAPSLIAEKPGEEAGKDPDVRPGEGKKGDANSSNKQAKAGTGGGSRGSGGSDPGSGRSGDSGESKFVPGEMARAVCLTTIASPAGVDARLRSALRQRNGDVEAADNAEAAPDYAEVKALVETCMTGRAANTGEEAGAPAQRSSRPAARRLAQTGRAPTGAP